MYLILIAIRVSLFILKMSFLNFKRYEFILLIRFSFLSFVLQMQLCMKPYERGDDVFPSISFFLGLFFDAAP